MKPVRSPLIQRTPAGSSFRLLAQTFYTPYKRHYSTETALLKVMNDLLMSVDKQNVTLLALLDVSAALDTVCQNTLLGRLENKFGVKGAALESIRSYLSARTQRVCIKGARSENFVLRHGVPQDSCLGPLMFSLYTSKLFDITKHHLPKVVCYADDTQLSMCHSVWMGPLAL